MITGIISHLVRLSENREKLRMKCQSYHCEKDSHTKTSKLRN